MNGEISISSPSNGADWPLPVDYDSGGLSKDFCMRLNTIFVYIRHHQVPVDAGPAEETH